MSSGDGLGTLILSIDFELDLDHQVPEMQRRLDAVRGELIDLTRSLRTPATWAVADPVLSAATEPILAAGCGHEIAVLGEPAWLGPGCGRMRLSRELTRRFDSARRAGLQVSTLALRNVEHVVELDLLLEHGVSALRGPTVDTFASAQRLASPPIRFGLWQPPVARKMPPPASWWLPATWLIRREIKRAIRRKSLVHFEIDAPRMVTAPEAALALVSAALRYAAAKRDAGQLAIRTIGELAVEALAQRSAAPTHSIMRPAA